MITKETKMPGNSPPDFNTLNNQQVNGGGMEPPRSETVISTDPFSTGTTINQADFWGGILVFWLVGLIVLFIKNKKVKGWFDRAKDYFSYRTMDKNTTFIYYFAMVKYALKQSEEAKTGWSLFAIFNMITGLHSKPGIVTLLKKHNENAGRAYYQFLNVVGRNEKYWMGYSVDDTERLLDLNHPSREAILNSIDGMLRSMPDRIKPEVENCYIDLEKQEKEIRSKANNKNE